MPSLGCAGCGACCQPLLIKMSRGQLTAYLANPYIVGSMRKDYQFMYDNWEPTGVVMYGSREWKCNVFDPVHNRCGDYENRPHTCRDFPFYARQQTWVDYRYLQCSYWLDVPAAIRPQGVRPLIPLEVL